ncbi:MAG TPA: helix-turn-helix domain-containing protein [Ramlibacter sp.]|uniref:helix-turn-helix domain-containing protein n=1 Tax=Ramlibacter sp. TaxID=1917967 RepID=UPI002ED36090
MSDAAVVPEGPSAGFILREAREAAGLHAATLAANLKVPVRKLEALEEDRYDLLPDAVFARALASSVCRALKIDPQPVLDRLPQTAQPRLVQHGDGLNAPFHAATEGPGPSWFDQVSKPVLVTVGVLVLGAVVLMFLPMVQSGLDTVLQANRPSDSAVPAPGAGVPAEVAPAAATTPAAAAPVPSATAPATTAAAPAAAVPTATPAVAVPAAAAASGPIGARGTILFRTRGPSWIQVTDGSGATIFRKLMESGESAGASGLPPLSVTIGSVEVTEVQVRGKPYNLGPVSKDNVARFEIK